MNQEDLKIILNDDVGLSGNNHVIKSLEVPAFTLVEPSLTCGHPKAKACTVLPSIYLQKSKSTITSQNQNQLLQVNAFMFVVVYHVCQSLGVNVVFEIQVFWSNVFKGLLQMS